MFGFDRDNLSYSVIKNHPDLPIIKFNGTFPEDYDHNMLFPIDVIIQEVDGTAKGKS